MILQLIGEVKKMFEEMQLASTKPLEEFEVNKKKNDLISRQDAIEAICHHGEIENDYTDIYHDGYCDGIYDAVDTIQNLPSADRCDNCIHDAEDWDSEACDGCISAEEFEWCHDCKEYDQEAHCCHRWTKVIRNTVEALKAERKGKWILQEDKTKPHYGWHICSECGAYIGEPSNYCSECGADMRGEEDAEQL